MSEPKFQHDCTKCQFMGHYYGHDVYFCKNAERDLGGSVVARCSSEPSNYASLPCSVLKDMWSNPKHLIGLGCTKQGEVMVPEKVVPFQEFMFSDEVEDYMKAMLTAMAVRGLNV